MTKYYQEIANSLADDFLYHNAGHIVKWELQRYHSLCDSDEVALKKAIECVLEDYMTPNEYQAWMKEI